MEIQYVYLEFKKVESCKSLLIVRDSCANECYLISYLGQTVKWCVKLYVGALVVSNQSSLKIQENQKEIHEPNSSTDGSRKII